MDLASGQAGFRGGFLGCVSFCSSSFWDIFCLAQKISLVLHWVHNLSEKDKDLQEEIFKELKHTHIIKPIEN